jgi:hypothetical protein
MLFKRWKILWTNQFDALAAEFFDNLAHLVKIPVICKAPTSYRMVYMTLDSGRFRTFVDRCTRAKGHNGSARTCRHFDQAAPIDTVGFMDAGFIYFSHLDSLSI